jgi:hypothetical protein
MEQRSIAETEELEMKPMSERTLCTWLVTTCCLSLLALPSFAADIRGKITSVTLANKNASGLMGWIFVEGAKERVTSVDKASINVMARTDLFKMRDGKKAVATFEDLKVGQMVEATFSGPVAESYPVQVTAGAIVILAQAIGASANPEAEPVIKEGNDVTLRGRLTGGMMGIGGETTGWVLAYEAGGARRQIDVDVSGMAANKIPEGAVQVTGKIFKKNYVERGPTLILKASKIEPAAALKQ